MPNNGSSRGHLEREALFSLSSWGAEGGTGELNGAKLAVEEINRAGGVAGQTLELIVEDNRSDLKSSASAFMKLSSVDRVPAIIGPNWMEFIDVVAPLAERDHIPVITPSGYRERDEGGTPPALPSSQLFSQRPRSNSDGVLCC